MHPPSRLAALREKELPNFIIGRLKPHVPLIEQLIDEGYSLEQVRKALADDGLDLKLSTLRSYLNRIRIANKDAAITASHTAPTAPAPPVSPATTSSALKNLLDIKKTELSFNPTPNSSDLI